MRFASFSYPNLLSLLLIPGVVGCQLSGPTTTSALFQETDPARTHVAFSNTLTEGGKLNILEYPYFYNGAGVAAGDVNNDGLTDLYFVSNQGSDKLYLNRGKQTDAPFGFEDVTAGAGLDGVANWKTGVTMADVNGDGWLDIYVCAVSQYLGLRGHNALYINKRQQSDGKVRFAEKAAEYGLALAGFSTQAAFFDYDHDGDLDCFLVNQAVHSAKSYGPASARTENDPLSGDYLFRNDKGHFTDVTRQSGIFQAPMGYGLGVSIADLNNDGWEDIYVANDFHEDDYYYLNQRGQTATGPAFRESLRGHFGHTSRFSMGCDAADLTNDGLADLMTLDMAPTDPLVEKSSMGEDPLDTYQYKLKFGYYYQFARNCLQINQGGGQFADAGTLAGVAATDWSWSTLLADFDNDGNKDIFVSNGIERRPNNLDYIRFVSANYQQFVQGKSADLDQKALSLMPDGRVPNVMFAGSGGMHFTDSSANWGFTRPTSSNGASYADLDNDGDLELITNNLNQPASIYENRASQQTSRHYLKINLAGNTPNTFGIGAQVFIKQNPIGQPAYLLTQQLMPTRGFMSSVEPILTFGLGEARQADTLIVLWPNGRAERRFAIQADTTITLRQTDATESAARLRQELFPMPDPLFVQRDLKDETGWRHQEDSYLNLSREPLVPFRLATEGPHLAVADVNNDGLADCYVNGGRGQAGHLFMQQPNGKFKPNLQPAFQVDTLSDGTDALFFDADGDQDQDLYVVRGGNEQPEPSAVYADQLYLNNGTGIFTRSDGRLPLFLGNKSCVEATDIDCDGDLDLFVGGRSVSQQYGIPPKSYLLINDGKGYFSDQTDRLAPALRQAGMVTDAVWADYDQDGDPDLLVVGDWMPIRIYQNEKGRLSPKPETPGLERSNGFWQVIKPADLDQDGDVDFIVGNIGTNTRLRRGPAPELRLYVGDFDQNQSLDHLFTYRQGRDFYPFANKDEWSRQIPALNKRFTKNAEFAGKSIREILLDNELSLAIVLTVNCFESVYLENCGQGRFCMHSLPDAAQLSKVFTIAIVDADYDTRPDVLLGGNLFDLNPYFGRYDGNHGQVLHNRGPNHLEPLTVQQSGVWLRGQVRAIEPVSGKGNLRLLVAGSDTTLVELSSLKPKKKRSSVKF